MLSGESDLGLFKIPDDRKPSKSRTFKFPGRVLSTSLQPHPIDTYIDLHAFLH